MNIVFYSHANKTHFRKKGFELNLVLKVSFWNLEIAYLTHSYRVIYTASYAYIFQSTWLNILSWSTKIAKMAALWGRWRRTSSNKKLDRSPSRGSHTSQIYSWKSLFFLLLFALNKRITFHNTMAITQQYVTRASIIPFVIGSFGNHGNWTFPVTAR